ncbi:DUF4006 domain-containing protein [Campylobacter sp. MIT 99-7217]|uniref:DUF4006 family protein n=1 Tax=Campylobacter sp. MIT 99-7217 TaxID=535091 RepID=UPI001158D807|nr:DUF4006 family protein [Campylobacter sp. MIT 99-7217]TQR32479.1 DUF4006 domain-containing protein [Campylobacter sp. MIT 99-7217]
MENTNRCVFGLDGIAGFLIAVVLLLAILVGLSIWGVKTQQNVMQKPYSLEKANEIKQFGSTREQHIIIKDIK